jgi:hypothetical protein
MFGLLLFACLDVTVKYLAARYDVPMIVAIRYAGNLVLMTALLAPRRGPEMLRTQRTGWVIARGLALSIGSLALRCSGCRWPRPARSCSSLLS